MHKIFISYSRSDYTKVVKLKNELEQLLGSGTCWIEWITIMTIGACLFPNLIPSCESGIMDEMSLVKSEHVSLNNLNRWTRA